MKKIIIALFLLSAFGACSKDEIKTYDGEAFAYFSPWEIRRSESFVDYYYDTLKYNFMFYPQTDTTLNAKITIGGKIEDYPRTVRLEVKTTGVENEDHDPVPTEVTVEAGSNFALVPISIHTTEALDEATFHVNMTILDNEYFKAKFTHSEYNKVIYDRRVLTLSYTSILEAPALWKSREFIVGYFSRAKMVKFNELTGLTLEDWLTNPSPLNNNFEGYMMLFANYLNSLIAKGPEYAIKDPDNPNAEDKGYMTITGGLMGVPEVTIPVDYPPAK